MDAFDPKPFLATLSTHPGVYRMIDRAGEVIYVGKARNLRNRVTSYFAGKAQNAKTMAMVEQIARIEVTVTASETEALLLEYNLIKRHRPRYNVVLRDDKSFPYLHVTIDQEFPRIGFYRGSRRLPGRYFGPYPSAGATRETLLLLQKLFRLRQCEDSYFANRTRPCLQYQIARCSAPCVGLIAREQYAQDVGDAIKVLEGRNAEVTDDLARRMETAATRLDFEQAAKLRDRIITLKKIQASQAVTRQSASVIDAVAVAASAGQFCVSVVFVRGGRNLGSSNFFPKAGIGESDEVLSGFLAQYYLGREAPREIVVDAEVEDRDLLEQSLSERSGHEVRIRARVRGLRARWLAMARTNAADGLRMRAANSAGIGRQLEAVGEALGLPAAPSRIECFDVSHTLGESTVASCVVFGTDGPIKADYRRFNIEGLSPGDDYGAMHQALERRYRRIQRGEAPTPDLLLIDGGTGQVREAAAVLEALGVTGVPIVGVAKGADRRPGQERLLPAGDDVPIVLGADSPALHLIQRIRDEAHRFAIAGHRQRRARTRRESVLEAIPGLGPRRRRELLRQFGGLQGVTRAGVEDLARVRGISRHLAETIYSTLHPGQ
jgi:excinuclease ABC subunit C